MIVGGRLRSKDGAAIVGARVELIDLANGGVIASSLSDARGNFRLDPAWEAAQKPRRLAIRAVGQGDDVLVEPVRLPRAKHDTVTIDLTASADRVRNFKPAAPMLARLTGSVLDPGVLPLLDLAVGLVVPKGEPGYNRFVRVVRHSLPALARFESVLDDAWMVLDGDLRAGQRLRRALSYLASLPVSAPRVASALFNIQPAGQPPLFPFPPPDNGFPIPEPGGPARSCSLPVDRLLPILAATLRIATDAEDGPRLLGGLEAGLSGIRRFESLNGLAQEALSSGKPGPLSDELSRLAVDLSIDDDRPFEEGLDWPYPPPDPIPPPPLELCHDLRTRCFQGLVDSWRVQFTLNQQNSVLPYQITSVRSDTACPGDIVTIEGSGFGTIPGKVLFPDRESDEPISVDPVPGTWTSGSIEAVVPAEAASGLIRLAILDGALSTCAGAVSVYRQGNGIAFRGGAPYVSSLTINGKVAGSVVAPDSDYVVAWRASPDRSTPDPVLVQVYEEPPLMPLMPPVFSQTMPASGNVPLRASNRSSPGTILAVVFAFGNNCGDAHGRRAEAIIGSGVPNIRIEGIEVTQGIQNFSLQGAQNTLITIAGKDTIVRVYVSAPLDMSGVTGMLDVDGTRLTPINGTRPNSPSAGNPFITARPVANINRTLTDHSLNFRIPAYLCSGTKNLYVLIWASGPGNTTLMDRQSLRWSWELKRALPVRFVRLQDDRPAPTGTGILPTDAEARQTLDRAFDLLPTPATDIAPAWPTTYSVISGNRSSLLTQLIGLQESPDPATSAPDLSIWIGLSDTFIFGTAAARSRVALAATYRNRDLEGPFRIASAHEIAHILGAACHTDESTCLLMLPYLSSSISLADVVFDPYWNQVFFPARDVMLTAAVFGDRHWISPALWDFLRLRIP